MTPKEKALNICEKMGFIKGEIMGINYLSKTYSMVAVNEIILFLTQINATSYDLLYWEEVEKEIQNVYEESIQESINKFKKL